MNIVFSVIMLLSLITLLIIAPSRALPALLSGGKHALAFSLTLFASYAVWLAVLNMLGKMQFNTWLGARMRPLLKKLFPNESDICYGYLSINLSANMLGMGSAATPAGISATESFTSKKNRTMLLVVNSTSIQLIPTTIVAMRADLNSASDIILPSLIATFVTTLLGMLLVYIFVKDKKA